jgi:hypothetical protein
MFQGPSPLSCTNLVSCLGGFLCLLEEHLDTCCCSKNHCPVPEVVRLFSILLLMVSKLPSARAHEYVVQLPLGVPDVRAVERYTDGMVDGVQTEIVGKHSRFVPVTSTV